MTSRIWFGVTLRGDNEPIEIGEGSNVQEHAIMHTDPGFPLTIGRGCTIGHRALLHGCTIGDNSLIGMGAIVLNGARIGRNSLVGAGALVTEGKEFPDDSLIVGAPAKAVRTLDEDAIARLRASAEHYVRQRQALHRGTVGSPMKMSGAGPGDRGRLLNPVVGDGEGGDSTGFSR